MKTHTAKPSDITRVWYLLDASSAPLGRVSTVAAKLLLGKDKVNYSHHIDVGDNVVIINCDKLVVTGDKLAKKQYFRHSGFPGGLRNKTLGQAMTKSSTEVMTKAIRGMLPVNKLRPSRLARLKVYSGNEHHHQAQNPITVPLAKRERG